MFGDGYLSTRMATTENCGARADADDVSKRICSVVKQATWQAVQGGSIDVASLSLFHPPLAIKAMAWHRLGGCTRIGCDALVVVGPAGVMGVLCAGDRTTTQATGNNANPGATPAVAYGSALNEVGGKRRRSRRDTSRRLRLGGKRVQRQATPIPAPHQPSPTARR